MRVFDVYVNILKYHPEYSQISWYLYLLIRPDKYKRRRKESQEVKEKYNNIIYII